MVVDAIAAGRASLSTYVQRLSRRERLLVAGLALIALVLAPLKAYDWSQAQFAALLDDKTSLQALQSQDNPAQIRRLSRLLADRRAEVRGWFWSAPSFPVARVMLEQQVAAAAITSGMTNPDVKSAEQADIIGGARFVRVELSGPITWPAFSGLMQRLSGSGKGFIIETVAVQDNGAAHDLRLVLLMPVVVGGR